MDIDAGMSGGPGSAALCPASGVAGGLSAPLAAGRLTPRGYFGEGETAC